MRADVSVRRQRKGTALCPRRSFTPAGAETHLRPFPFLPSFPSPLTRRFPLRKHPLFNLPSLLSLLFPFLLLLSLLFFLFSFFFFYLKPVYLYSKYSIKCDINCQCVLQEDKVATYTQIPQSLEKLLIFCVYFLEAVKTSPL